MYLIKEYAVQIVLAAIQIVLVVYGTLTTAAILKAANQPEFINWNPAFPIFIRNWGFLALLIPGAWVIATIWMERKHYDWFSTSETIISGAGVIIFLGFLFLCSVNKSFPSGL